jgi:general stress protein YciG
MNGNSRKGFASLSPEARKEIAAIGGRSVPADRRAYSTNNTLAREAGRKGGLAFQAKRRAMMDPSFSNSTVETNS